MSWNRLFLVVLVATISIVDPASQVSAEAAPPQPAPQSRATTIQDLLALEARIQQSIKEHVTNAVQASNKDVLERATKAQESAESLISVVRWVSSGWLGVVSLIFAVLLFIGWRELGVLKTARDEVTAAKDEVGKAVSRAKEAETEATGSVGRIQEFDRVVRDIRTATEKALADITGYLDRLPERLARLGILGQPPELPAPDELARFEEADFVIAFAEMTGFVSREGLAKPYVRLGGYWLLLQNYPRAIARYKKAIMLDERSDEAHRGLCTSLYAVAAQARTPPAFKKRLLDAAEEQCGQVIDLVGKDPLVMFQLGWIHDERADYERAVTAYLEARALDAEGRYPNITYNLSCSYSKWGKQSEAFDEIQKVIDKDENSIDAMVDGELAGLRKDPVFGPRLEGLVRNVTARREA